MIAHVTTLTRKGQITLPAEVRQALGLRRGDKLSVVLEDGKATVSRADSVVARTAGVVTSAERPFSAEELRDAAEQAWAEERTEEGA